MRSFEFYQINPFHIVERHDLYSLPNIVRVIRSRRKRWPSYAERIWRKKNTFRILVGKPEGKKSLWTPRHGWEDSLMDFNQFKYVTTTVFIWVIF